ncbi:DUF1573 domain-containing protein [Thalassoglobus polymorphus]|uniref:DUF1573 domain-containing protein n=1 Tax=Thalassoglobus polymorphus TaxID=2527994 RepID=A0A517QSV2_9PLAN|nr:DUF1573 domain-containing protein [Thalassoglobus polymorphus]QDT34710.1 hypothetical protein Mal48_39820 [Thalassoglobus polymorphus]
MKIAQIAAVMFTLLLSLGIVLWLADSAPTTVHEKETEALPPDAPVDTPTEDGVHNINPFTPTTEGPQPKVVIESLVHDFGAMALGQTGTHNFIIRNEGEAPLKLAKGQVQCKCTVSGLQDEEVPVGGEAKIHLEWTPKSMGPFGQGAVIWTNDPANEKLELRVEGEMVSEININPENGWILANVPSGRPTKIGGGISTGLHDSFEITSIETTSDRLTFTSKPMLPEDLAAQNAKSGFELIGEYNPPDEAGKFRETVTVKTSLDKYAKIVLNVTGSRTGPIAIIASGWMAGKRLLNLGRVSEKKGKKHRLTMMVEPFEEELKILDSQIQPNFITVDFEAAENSETATRHRYTLNLEIPPGSPAGVWRKDSQGKIVLTTNHPKLKEIIINLEMVIQ